jgi:hypothetical protein
MAFIFNMGCNMKINENEFLTTENYSTGFLYLISAQILLAMEYVVSQILKSYDKIIEIRLGDYNQVPTVVIVKKDLNSVTMDIDSRLNRDIEKKCYEKFSSMVNILTLDEDYEKSTVYSDFPMYLNMKK